MKHNFAFCEFESPEQANLAVISLDGKIVNDEKLLVELSYANKRNKPIKRRRSSRSNSRSNSRSYSRSRSRSRSKSR